MPLTNFPGSLDVYVNPASGDLLSSVVVPHWIQHSQLNDAVTAIQTKIGIDGSSVTSSFDYLLKNTASVNPGHKHTFGALTDVTLSSPASGEVLYYTGSHWTNSNLTSSFLTGLSISPSSTIASTDTILQAFGKLQAELNTIGVTAAVPTTRTLQFLGTTNQISVDQTVYDLSANRTWTFSLPQDIHTGASPTFTGLTLSGLAGTGTRITLTSSAGVFSALTLGTTSQYLRGDNSYQTLNQAAVAGLTTASSPTFTGLTLSATLNTSAGHIQTGTSTNTFSGATTFTASSVALTVNNKIEVYGTVGFGLPAGTAALSIQDTGTDQGILFKAADGGNYLRISFSAADKPYFDSTIGQDMNFLIGGSGKFTISSALVSTNQAFTASGLITGSAGANITGQTYSTTGFLVNNYQSYKSKNAAGTAVDLFYLDNTDNFVFEFQGGKSLIFDQGGSEAGRFSPARRFLLGSATDDGTNKLQVTGSAIISSSLYANSSHCLFYDFTASSKDYCADFTKIIRTAGMTSSVGLTVTGLSTFTYGGSSNTALSVSGEFHATLGAGSQATGVLHFSTTGGEEDKIIGDAKTIHLADVSTTAATTTGQFLRWNQSTTKWEPYLPTCTLTLIAYDQQLTTGDYSARMLVPEIANGSASYTIKKIRYYRGTSTTGNTFQLKKNGSTSCLTTAISPSTATSGSSTTFSTSTVSSGDTLHINFSATDASSYWIIQVDLEVA